jgi:outer membrane protein assembly factor BamB
VDGERVYVATNRCEVVCLDPAGMSNGNDGPFKDEAQYLAGAGKPAIEPEPHDADILWVYDMRVELGVFPHFMTSSSVLVVGDWLYVTTSNGVDWTDVHVPSPDAPVLICLDKKTGKLLGQERSGISARTLYGNWSSPAYGSVGGKPTVVVGGGDGFLYGFDPVPVTDASGAATLKELWRVDCNPPEYRMKDDKPLRYRDPKGPSEVIATPVVHGNRVYASIGQDPEHPEQGAGCLNSIGVTYDASGKATAQAVWRNTKIGRSVSTVAVTGGIVFTADSAGMIYCLDAATGNEHWKHDAEAHIWVSPVVADGKLYLGNENGELLAFAASKEKQELGKIDCGASIFSSAVPANGVLFVATGQQLYAFKGGARPAAQAPAP